MNKKIVAIVVALVVVSGIVAAFLSSHQKSVVPNESATAPAPVVAPEGAEPSPSTCTVSPGEPKIRKDKYPDYKIERGTAEFSESIKLADGTPVQIYSAGCHDIVTTRVMLIAPASASQTTASLMQWTNERIQDLELTEAAEFIKTEIGDFAYNAEVTKAAGEVGSGESIRLCADGTPPEEGGDCDWEQGGSVELRTETLGDTVRITFELKTAG